MTIQSAFLLRQLRRAQISEDRSVYIDFDNLTASTFHDATQSYKTVSLKIFRNSINAILNYLEKTGYIQQIGYSDFQVLHLGWHTNQAFIEKLMSFLFRSILVPIGVSIATTLLMMLIEGKLNQPS